MSFLSIKNIYYKWGILIITKSVSGCYFSGKGLLTLFYLVMRSILSKHALSLPLLLLNIPIFVNYHPPDLFWTLLSLQQRTNIFHFSLYLFSDRNLSLCSHFFTNETIDNPEKYSKICQSFQNKIRIFDLMLEIRICDKFEKQMQRSFLFERFLQSV